MPNKELGKAFHDGEIIFRQGDVADSLYIILSGKVVIYREEAEGEVVTLAELEKGDIFGEMGVFMDPIRSEGARSLGATRVITANYKFVMKKFIDDPSFAFTIIETMAKRARTRTEELEKRLENLTIHEGELTSQNLELREARKAGEAGEVGKSLEDPREKNADYYDFAPVGAIDLDETGIIRGINLMGAAMLGTKRRDLLDLPFAPFVTQENQDAYQNHLQACKGSSDVVMTRMMLNPKKGDPVKVQIFSYPKSDLGQVVYRTVMTDFTK